MFSSSLSVPKNLPLTFFNLGVPPASGVVPGVPVPPSLVSLFGFPRLGWHVVQPPPSRVLPPDGVRRLRGTNSPPRVRVTHKIPPHLFTGPTFLLRWFFSPVSLCVRLYFRVQEPSVPGSVNCPRPGSPLGCSRLVMRNPPFFPPPPQPHVV